MSDATPTPAPISYQQHAQEILSRLVMLVFDIATASEVETPEVEALEKTYEEHLKAVTEVMALGLETAHPDGNVPPYGRYE